MQRIVCLMLFCGHFFAGTAVPSDTPVETPRPVPATRPQMKQLLEDMKQRPYRIPLPELTDADRQALGDRSDSYESRLRFHYLPPSEGSVFGAGRSSNRSAGDSGQPAPRRDFRRNADENMSLSYQFKTMLFWIVSRTNNCQYCLGHQEWKLSATGMSEEAIAALDSDWSGYSAAEQAAFRWARLLTFEPHRLDDAAIESVGRYYTPLQIVEMTMSVAGNNAINRWKEGTGIPQSAGNTFARRSGDNSSGSAEHSDTFVTPTPARFQNLISIVAPLELRSGQPTGRGISTRPPLETREQVMAALHAAGNRTARLPMAADHEATEWLKEIDSNASLSNWARLLAVFPNEGRGRAVSLLARETQTGELTVLQKAQINWIVARQDRAWYAVGQALRTLRSLQQSDDQIFALDGDRQQFSPADQALFQFATKLAAAPIALTNEDVALALAETSPRHVVQLINHVASCAYFNRVTEAAGLPLDE